MIDATTAAGVLVVHPTKPDYVLAVTRGWNPFGGLHDWNLPGGLIEPYETPIEAALRELREETGILLTLDNLHPYPFVYPTVSGRYAAYYKCRANVPDWYPMSSWEGWVRWRHISVLLRSRNQYRLYNEALFRHFGLLNT